MVIENPEVYLNNSNLSLKKNIIWFKLLAQKREIDK